MASLWKHPESKYFFACFTTRDGKRKKVSTKCVDRKSAQKIADKYEEAYRKERTAQQVHKVLRQAHEELTGEAITEISVRDYVQRWTDRKKAEGVAESSMKFYRHCTGRFVEWLGEDAKRSLTWVTREKLEQFRRSLTGQLAHKTIQHQLKGVRMLFHDARRDYGIENPAEFLKVAKAEKGASAVKKAAFTIDALRVLVRHLEGEWLTLTLLGAYSGARLADLQNLKWECVDLGRSIITFTTRKTGRPMRTPIARPLARHLEALPDRKGFVVPGLAAKKTNSLSGEFTDHLRRCGLRSGGSTSGPRRNVGLSFHSLRHGLVSMLKEGGVSGSVAQEFAGHDSAKMSEHYTSVSDESMRQAANCLPDLEAGIQPITDATEKSII